MACLILKKQYLDETSENVSQLSIEDIRQIKEQVAQSINFSQSLAILKKKAEVIGKCCKKMDNYGELIPQLVQMFNSQEGGEDVIVTRKIYTMYMFELLAEYHLPQEQLT